MIAIAGGKGGCGKTTTTVGLARALSRAGVDVLVVDADVDMPDLHVVLDGHQAPGLRELAHGASPSSVVQTDHAVPGVGLIAAGCEGDPNVARCLSPLRGVPERVLVDTAAGASRPVARAIAVADAVLVVSTPTKRSLTDTAKTAAMARALETPLVGLVCTHSDGTVDPSPLFECTTLGHVPTVKRPLKDSSTTTEYEKIMSHVNKRNI